MPLSTTHKLRWGLYGATVLAGLIVVIGFINTTALSRRSAWVFRSASIVTELEILERVVKRTVGERCDLTFRLGYTLPRVEADRGQVEQVLLNLALNAADAMPDGGTLTVATTEVQLPRDIGAQGDFPVAKAAAPATDVPEPVLRSTPARGLVMVVEDEPAGRTMVARVLQEEGYEVVSAQDGQEALSALVKRNGVRLVVSDVAMPVMSGRELGDTLALTHPDLPVLYMSGFADAEIISRGLLAPGRPFIQKPFATDLFARRVVELLQQRAP